MSTTRRDCGTIGPLLSGLLDDELGRSEKRSVQEHLGGCAACSSSYRRMQAMVAGLRELPRKSAGPEFLVELRRRIDRGDADRLGAWGWLQPDWFRINLAAGAVLTAVIGLVAFNSEAAREATLIPGGASRHEVLTDMPEAAPVPMEESGRIQPALALEKEKGPQAPQSLVAGDEALELKSESRASGRASLTARDPEADRMDEETASPLAESLSEEGGGDAATASGPRRARPERNAGEALEPPSVSSLSRGNAGGSGGEAGLDAVGADSSESALPADRDDALRRKARESVLAKKSVASPAHEVGLHGMPADTGAFPAQAMKDEQPVEGSEEAFGQNPFSAASRGRAGMLRPQAAPAPSAPGGTVPAAAWPARPAPLGARGVTAVKTISYEKREEDRLFFSTASPGLAPDTFPQLYEAEIPSADRELARARFAGEKLDEPRSPPAPESEEADAGLDPSLAGDPNRVTVEMLRHYLGDRVIEESSQSVRPAPEASVVLKVARLRPFLRALRDRADLYSVSDVMATSESSLELTVLARDGREGLEAIAEKLGALPSTQAAGLMFEDLRARGEYGVRVMITVSGE